MDAKANCPSIRPNLELTPDMIPTVRTFIENGMIELDDDIFSCNTSIWRGTTDLMDESIEDCIDNEDFILIVRGVYSVGYAFLLSFAVFDDEFLDNTESCVEFAYLSSQLAIPYSEGFDCGMFGCTHLEDNKNFTWFLNIDSANPKAFYSETYNRFLEESKANGWLAVSFRNNVQSPFMAKPYWTPTEGMHEVVEDYEIVPLAVASKEGKGLDRWEVNEDLRDIFEHFFAAPYRKVTEK